jgi:hypothetical protein
MPRNGSGTYTLPAGNPVVAGTTIEATWANTTLNDVATEMTGSLSRAGSGGMTGPLRLDAGSAAVPALAWSTETTTGLYRAGANDVRLAVATSDVMRWQAAGVSVTGTLGVSAAVTLSTTLAVTGAATLSSTLAVTGTTTLTGAATLTANPTLSAGTANGVLYLDGSKVATSGSALTFDGTYFTANGLRLAGTDVTNTIYQATGALGITTGTAAGITFATNLTTRMTLDGSGNLGIGTASPGQRLAVRSADNSGTTNIARFESNNAAQAVQIRFASVLGDGGDFTTGTSTNHNAIFSTNATERMRLDASGNLGIGTSTFGTSAAGVLSIANGTAPTTGPADTVQLFSVDRSAGNTIPAVRCEGSGVTNAGITNTTVTHKIAMQVNGTIYYLLATTNAT